MPRWSRSWQGRGCRPAVLLSDLITKTAAPVIRCDNKRSASSCLVNLGRKLMWISVLVCRGMAGRGRLVGGEGMAPGR